MNNYIFTEFFRTVFKKRCNDNRKKILVSLYESDIGILNQFALAKKLSRNDIIDSVLYDWLNNNKEDISTIIKQYQENLI